MNALDFSLVSSAALAVGTAAGLLAARFILHAMKPHE